MARTRQQNNNSNPEEQNSENSEVLEPQPEAIAIQPVDEAVTGSVDRLMDVIERTVENLSGDEAERNLLRQGVTSIIQDTLLEFARPQDINMESMQMGLIQPMSENTQLGSAEKTTGQAIDAAVRGSQEVGMAFVDFTQGLITGTFNAIIKATIDQMKAYTEMVADLTKSLKEFASENVSEDAIDQKLAQLTFEEKGSDPDNEWELSDLIQMITAELDQAQDTLILKSQSRRLSMMVNQLNLDLQVDVRHDTTGKLMFRTASPGTTGSTVLKLGFTPALDTQVQDTRKSIDIITEEYHPLETLVDIQPKEIQQLKNVGIHSVNDLEAATKTSGMLVEVASKTQIQEARIRQWRQLPFIVNVTPASGTPGSRVVLDVGNFGSLDDQVEVYFQNELATIYERTNARIIVEMPKDITGNGWIVAKFALGVQK